MGNYQEECFAAVESPLSNTFLTPWPNCPLYLASQASKGKVHMFRT